MQWKRELGKSSNRSLDLREQTKGEGRRRMVRRRRRKSMKRRKEEEEAEEEGGMMVGGGGGGGVGGGMRAICFRWNTFSLNFW